MLMSAVRALRACLLHTTKKPTLNIFGITSSSRYNAFIFLLSGSIHHLLSTTVFDIKIVDIFCVCT